MNKNLCMTIFEAAKTNKAIDFSITLIFKNNIAVKINETPLLPILPCSKKSSYPTIKIGNPNIIPSLFLKWIEINGCNFSSVSTDPFKPFSTSLKFFLVLCCCYLLM